MRSAPAIRLPLMLGALFLFARSSSAAEPPTDWPRWRGPNADGVAEGRELLIEWSEKVNIVWSAELPGWGTSSPVVYGDRVFVTSQTKKMVGNPGRHEIDDTQELNYAAICKAIVGTGFKGFVAQEFIPLKDTVASLKQAFRICDV